MCGPKAKAEREYYQETCKTRIANVQTAKSSVVYDNSEI